MFTGEVIGNHRETKVSKLTFRGRETKVSKPEKMSL